jgi:hypothetical protein
MHVPGLPEILIHISALNRIPTSIAFSMVVTLSSLNIDQFENISSFYLLSLDN